MSRNVRKEKLAGESMDPIHEYVLALEAAYPPAKGETRIVVGPNRSVIVNAPLPTRARERMKLFDTMAEVGTRLLLETDRYIILSSR